MMLICPCCEQGVIVKAFVKKIDLKIKICDECDVIWQENEEINVNTGISYDVFAKNNNILPIWDELEVIVE